MSSMHQHYRSAFCLAFVSTLGACKGTPSGASSEQQTGTATQQPAPAAAGPQVKLDAQGLHVNGKLLPPSPGPDAIVDAFGAPSRMFGSELIYDDGVSFAPEHAVLQVFLIPFNMPTHDWPERAFKGSLYFQDYQLKVTAKPDALSPSLPGFGFHDPTPGVTPDSPSRDGKVGAIEVSVSWNHSLVNYVTFYLKPAKP